MKGVKFGNFHSWDDFFLILGSKEIETPSAKTETVEIPGADGVLDLTEYFGEPRYKNRKLSFSFSTIVPQSQFLELFTSIQSKLHGQKMNIVLDDDSEFYYVGRISVSKFENEKGVGKISIECDCEPFKYKKEITSISQTLNGSIQFNFRNLRKSVIPTITVTGETTIIFDNSTFVLSAGTYSDERIMFTGGNNLLTATGANVTLTVEYREGTL